jgi:hypothetical protein
MLTNGSFQSDCGSGLPAAMLADAVAAREFVLRLGRPSNAEAPYSHLLCCLANRIPTPFRPTFCSGFQRICAELYGDKSAKVS